MPEKIKSYRYPGVRPFSADNRDIFFGRDDDSNRLFKLIMLEKLVVLFGKSGYGKSSLINASIIPKFIDQKLTERFHYHPIVVRIGKVSGQNESPLSKVIAKLNEQFDDLPEWSFINAYQKLPLLWSHFKKKQSVNRRKFLLIFDQFEEFFTYSKKEQDIFRWEHAELMYTEIPQMIRENIDNISNENYALLSSRLDIKLLFSIRSDRLSLLHSLKDAIPNVLNNTFEIKGLSSDQARQAIEMPALINDEKFITHSFRYDNDSINIILKELLSHQGDGSENIEAFHLQIICQACENKIQEKLTKGEIDTEINQEDLPEFHNLYEEYYKRQIEKLPVNLRSKAQSVLEEGLIFEDSQTGECHRLSVDGNILRKQFDNSGTQDNLLNLLENTFLVRREPNTVGGFSYEISHDSLIQPITKIRRKREAEKQLQKQIENIRIKALKESTLKRRRQIFLIAGVFIVLLVAGLYWKNIYFGYTTFIQQNVEPTIRLSGKLNKIVAELEDSLLNDAKKINTKDSSIKDPIGAWEASQIVTALKGDLRDPLKRNFYQLTSNSIDDSSCCCWVESINEKDLRPTGWVVSAIGALNMTANYKCDIISFFLDNQLIDGSWSAYLIDKTQIKYGSTYATCHVLRALHNSLQNISNSSYKKRIEQSINKGVHWLLNNMVYPKKSSWTDYPKNKSYEDLLSFSLSGLAIHTLNLINSGSLQPVLNRQWLNNLKNSQAFTEIDHKEQSDMFYKFGSAVAEFSDRTRHLVVPWQIIATVDAFKDGTLRQRFHANAWLDIMVDNLDITNINKNPRYIKAEILIALRYLQNKGYKFQ